MLQIYWTFTTVQLLETFCHTFPSAFPSHELDSKSHRSDAWYVQLLLLCDTNKEASSNRGVKDVDGSLIVAVVTWRLTLLSCGHYDSCCCQVDILTVAVVIWALWQLLLSSGHFDSSCCHMGTMTVAVVTWTLIASGYVLTLTKTMPSNPKMQSSEANAKQIVNYNVHWLGSCL